MEIGNHYDEWFGESDLIGEKCVASDALDYCKKLEAAGEVKSNEDAVIVYLSGGSEWHLKKSK